MKYKKLLFWIILGALSTFFAEVSAGSSRFPFFTIWGIFMVFPLYTLHTLFFASLIYRYGKPTFLTLFLGGTLFGMYEAYITKVVWISYMETGPMFQFLGIALFETLLLVLFWHALLAFVVPVVLGGMLTKKSEITLPARLNSKKVLCGIVIFAGMFTAVNSPSPLGSLLSTGLSGLVVIALILYWNKKGYNHYSMKELMPSDSAFKKITVAMIAMYVIFGRLLNWDQFPSIPQQMTVWVIYAGLIYLFVKILKNPENGEVISHKAVRAEMWLIFGLYVAFAIAAKILHLEILMVIIAFVLVLPGFYWLYRAKRQVY